MFAFIGLGVQEMILLGVFAAAIAVIVFIVIMRSAGSSAAGGARADGAADRIAALEEENRRLRAELDQARGKREGSV